MKKLSCVLVVMMFILSLSACAIFDSEIHGDVQYDEMSLDVTFTYAGVKYTNYNEVLHFAIDRNESDILLGYHHSLKGYRSFHAEKADAPDYAYVCRDYERYSECVYFREGINYLTQVLVLEGADVSFVLSDALNQTERTLEEDTYLEHYSVDLYMKDYPRVKLWLYIYSLDGKWYYTYNQQNWILSDAFVEALIANDILE